MTIKASPVWQHPTGGGRLMAGFTFADIEPEHTTIIADFVAGDYAKRHTGQTY